jgi:hypothetical protein
LFSVVVLKLFVLCLLLIVKSFNYSSFSLYSWWLPKAMDIPNAKVYGRKEGHQIQKWRCKERRKISAGAVETYGIYGTIPTTTYHGPETRFS